MNRRTRTQLNIPNCVNCDTGFTAEKTRQKRINYSMTVKIMVLMVDGYVVIGAHVRSNLCYFIFLTNLSRSRAIRNRIFSSKDLFSVMRAHYILSYHPI